MESAQIALVQSSPPQEAKYAGANNGEKSNAKALRDGEEGKFEKRLREVSDEKAAKPKTDERARENNDAGKVLSEKNGKKLSKGKILVTPKIGNDKVEKRELPPPFLFTKTVDGLRGKIKEIKTKSADNTGKQETAEGIISQEMIKLEGKVTPEKQDTGKTIIIELGRGKQGKPVPTEAVREAGEEKKFFFIDKRTGSIETKGKTEAVEVHRKTAKGGKGELPRDPDKTGIPRRLVKEEQKPQVKADPDVRQLVKEEVLESSEKIIKFSSETQTKQTVQQQNDTIGQKHTQSAQLQRQLAEYGNKQIVKQTGIILKNENSGEIRLVLKPESLGKVRIQLQMQDNAITGKILVDNTAVKTAFDQNLDSLYRAFKESGFETAQLDVQVGGERSGKKDNGEEDVPGFALHRIQAMEEQIPLSGGEKSADTLINLVV